MVQTFSTYITTTFGLVVDLTDRRCWMTRRQMGKLFATSAVGSSLNNGNFQTAEKTKPGEIIWEKPDLGFFTGFLTVVDGVVYVKSSNGVHALDANDGTGQWLSDYPNGKLTVVNGVVYTLTVDKLVGLDASKGDELWRFNDISGSVYSGPTVTDDVAYFGTIDTPAVYGIETETREVIWRNTDPEEDVKTWPTVADGTVYVGCIDHNIYAMDAETGVTEWTNTDPVEHTWSSPTVAYGTVYVGSSDTNLYALDADSGETVWRNSVPDHQIDSSPTVADGIVYVGSYHDGLYAIDAGTGEIAWKRTSIGNITSPTVSDGVVYAASRGGNVYAVKADSGETLWKLSDFEPPMGRSPVVVDGVLFVTGYKSVYAIDAGVEGSSNGSRVELGTLGHHHAWANQEDNERPSITIEEPRLVQTVENTRLVAEDSDRDIANHIGGLAGEGLVNASGAGVTKTVQDPDLIVGRGTSPVFDLDVTNPLQLPGAVDAKLRVFSGDSLVEESTFAIDSAAILGEWPDGRRETYEQFVDLPEYGPLLEWLAADELPIIGRYPVFPAQPESVVELVIGGKSIDGDSYRFDLRTENGGPHSVVQPRPLSSLTRRVASERSETTYLSDTTLRPTLSIGFIPAKNDTPVVGYQFEDEPNVISFAEKAAKRIQRLFPVTDVNVAVVEKPFIGMSTIHPKSSGPIAGEARRRLQASLDEATSFTISRGRRNSRPPLTELDVVCAVIPEDGVLSGHNHGAVPWPDSITARRPPGMVAEIGWPQAPAHEAGHYFLGDEFYEEELAFEADSSHISRSVYSTGYDLEDGMFEVKPGIASVMGPAGGPWIDAATYQGLIDSEFEAHEMPFGESLIDAVNEIYRLIKELAQSIRTLLKAFNSVGGVGNRLPEYTAEMKSKVDSIESDLAALRGEIDHYREGIEVLPASLGSRLEATAENAGQVSSALRDMDIDESSVAPGIGRIIEVAPDRLDAIGKAVAKRANTYDPGWMLQVYGTYADGLEATYDEYPTFSPPTGFEGGDAMVIVRDANGAVLAERTATTSMDVQHQNHETETTNDVILAGVPLPRAAREVEISAEFASSDGRITTSIDPVIDRLEYAITGLPKRAFTPTETRGNLLERVQSVAQFVENRQFEEAIRELGEVYRILSETVHDGYEPDAPGEISKIESLSIVASHKERFKNDVAGAKQQSLAPWIIGGLTGAIATGYLLKRRIRAIQRGEFGQ